MKYPGRMNVDHNRELKDVLTEMAWSGLDNASLRRDLGDVVHFAEKLIHLKKLGNEEIMIPY